MFDKNPNDDQPEQTRPAFVLPALNTWKVRRFKPDHLFSAAPGTIEEFVITAHGINVGDNGAITFMAIRVDPVMGPQSVAVRGFSDYIDFEDVTPAESSLIVQ